MSCSKEETQALVPPSCRDSDGLVQSISVVKTCAAKTAGIITTGDHPQDCSVKKTSHTALAAQQAESKNVQADLLYCRQLIAIRKDRHYGATVGNDILCGTSLCMC